MIFRNALTYNNELCDVIYSDADDFNNIPDDLKIKAQAVCIYKEKMAVVHLLKHNVWALPGGTRKKGEKIEDTLIREVKEEVNCEVVDFRPISYQKIISPSTKNYHYRLQYICNVIPLDNYKADLDEDIDNILWIEPKRFEEYIENKEFRRMPIKRATYFLCGE